MRSSSTSQSQNTLNNQETRLFAAIRANRDITQILQEGGINVNCQDKSGRTPVYMAAAYGHVEAIKTLAELRANVDTAAQNGATPVYIAAQQGHIEAIKTLAELGANVNTAKQGGFTPVFIAAHQGHIEAIKTLAELGANTTYLEQHPIIGFDWQTPVQEGKKLYEEKLAEQQKQSAQEQESEAQSDPLTLTRTIEALRKRIVELEQKELIHHEKKISELRSEAKELMKDPGSFIDPISQAIMTNPKLTSAGQAYQDESIRDWLSRSRVDPNTMQDLGDNPQLLPVHALKGAIEEFAANTQSGALDLANKFIDYGQPEDAQQMIVRAAELNEKFPNEEFRKRIEEAGKDLASSQSRQNTSDTGARGVVPGSVSNLAQSSRGDRGNAPQI